MSDLNILHKEIVGLMANLINQLINMLINQLINFFQSMTY